jgi:uncharacterized membrane protein
LESAEVISYSFVILQDETTQIAGCEWHLTGVEEVITRMKIEEEAGYGLNRLINFSDAVIAIAITLLVLEIRLPEGVRGLPDDVITREVLSLWPAYLGYFTSFWVIGLYWLAHHRIFRAIRYYDRRLMMINLAFLFTVAFMPFPTALLFDYGGVLIAVLLYAGTLMLAGLSLVGLWLYASHDHRLITPTLEPDAIRNITRGLLAAPGVFLLSIVVAFFNADLAMYLWLLQIPAYFLTRPPYMPE